MCTSHKGGPSSRSRVRGPYRRGTYLGGADPDTLYPPPDLTPDDDQQNRGWQGLWATLVDAVTALAYATGHRGPFHLAEHDPSCRYRRLVYAALPGHR